MRTPMPRYLVGTVFAPARFRDQVKFAWEYDEPQHGWTARGGAFRSALSGGNEEGYRTFA